MKKILLTLLIVVIISSVALCFVSNSIANPFVDVKPKDYFFDAVNWAYVNNITSGIDKTHFDPNGNNTRAQMVTFLWRSVNCPNPSSLKTPYKDIEENKYYSKAVAWAVEKGITSGTSPDTFSPDITVTRGQTVTFLYRFVKAENSGFVSPFVDVKSSDYWYDAICWAYACDITNGMDSTHFAPDSNCTRGQIVTLIWRLICEKKLTKTEYTDGMYDNFSDTLSMPRITKVLNVKQINGNLDSILTNGYGSEGYAENLFNSVKDNFIIFYSGKGSLYCYKMGVKTPIINPLLYSEESYYIAFEDLYGILGGEFETTGRAQIKISSSLTVGDLNLSCVGGNKGIIKNLKSGETSEADCISRSLYSEGRSVYKHCLNVNDIPRLYGLNVYVTDSGLLIISNGKALDEEKGFYIAEEAVKLFLENEEEKEIFSQNEFVDIPNIITHTGNNITAYSFPSLDLNANVLSYALQGVKSPVALAPSIVAGQGNNPENQTIVRVFDQYQTLYTQFNAYPASVKGGVQVATATDSSNSHLILTSPYSDKSITKLKVYDVNGSYRYSVFPSTEAPYAIGSGKFVNGKVCFAVMSMNDRANKKLEFFSVDNGELIKSVQLDISSTDPATLSTQEVTNGNDKLIISFVGDTTVSYVFELSSGISKINTDGNHQAVYNSAFGGLLSTLKASDKYNAFSDILNIDTSSKINVGEKENLFFDTLAQDRNDTYVRKGNFWHKRLEFLIPVWQDIRHGETGLLRQNNYSNFDVNLDTDPNKAESDLFNTQYNMWEACATHRWNVTVQTEALMNYLDPNTGLSAYGAFTRHGETINYKEMSNTYFNATYSPNIPALNRLNYWTLRSYYSKLAPLYRSSPEKTVAVSPVHEHEITTDADSVGDYNMKMIAGFADWLESLYGNIETVNRIYGTSFASFSVLDAPRNLNRGAWDSYTSNPYFTMWVMYNRSIVSQHIIESYRECILAGFPSEMIKAHQIPEGDAVAALLGRADTRVTPVDVALACGTGYGATRYGVWYSNNQSFFSLAVRSGQRNITLGEYNATTPNKEDAYKQLKYMFNNGLAFVDIINFSTDSWNQSEQYAVDKLQGENIPRAASSGGTISLHPFDNGNEKYNIVQLGDPSTDPGLLKSVNKDGSFEGTVYLQPFHAAVKAENIAEGISKTGNGIVTYNVNKRKDSKGSLLPGINYNDMIDIRLNASSLESHAGTITIKIFCNDLEIPCLTYSFQTDTTAKEYRYLFKNQTFFEKCQVVVDYKDVDISDGSITQMYEMDARKYYNEMNPSPHIGGVSFDVFD